MCSISQKMSWPAVLGYELIDEYVSSTNTGCVKRDTFEVAIENVVSAGKKFSSRVFLSL